MDIAQNLTDECRDVLLRAGELAGDQGRRQVTSADLLAAIAEQDTSAATEIIDLVAATLAVDEEAVKSEILSEYTERTSQ